MSKFSKEVLLIDGRNWCYRHGFTKGSLFSKNRPTGVLYGSLSGLIRLHRYFPDAAIVFCWDGVDVDNSWRHRLAQNYKGNRKRKPGETPIPIQNVRKQIPQVEKLVAQLGFKSFSVPKIEADDLIGILATKLKTDYDKIIIYSTDKDFYQLIRDNVVVVRDFDKNANCKEVTEKEIKKKHGVYPKHWLHFRSLIGEHTDNIAQPVPNVGPKRAIKMLKAGVDPSSLEPHKDYKEHWDKIRLCYKLTKILRKVADRRIDKISQRQIRIILKQIEGKSLFRNPNFKTKENFDKFCEFLVEYELSDIFMRRMALWNIR